MTKSAVTFTEEIVNGKLHFLCNAKDNLTALEKKENP